MSIFYKLLFQKMNNPADYLSLITTQINEIIANDEFAKDFTFLEGQREVITNVGVNYLKWRNGYSLVDTVVIYAPTGYGKSILAMFISKLLQRLKYSTYILTVDLILQQQYESDIKGFNLNYRSVKGTDNYRCSENGKNFTEGECHSLNLSYAKLSTLKCYKTCAYLQARNNAIKAKVSLLNYQYWLMQRNHVARKMETKAPFLERDLTIFDEAHKLDDIVRSFFSIKLSNSLANSLGNVEGAILDEGFSLTKQFSKSKISEILFTLRDSSDKEVLKDSLNDLANEISLILTDLPEMLEFAKEGVSEGSYLSDEWSKIFKVLSEYEDLVSKIDDYLNLTTEIGLKNIIARKEDDSIEFVSLKDDYLVKKYVLAKAGFKVFMSATFGNVNKFISIIGLQKAIVLQLANKFDYDNSPIFVFKKCRLDYKNKHVNIDKAVKLVDKIISDHHLNHNGIIHTASYEFTKILKSKSKYASRFIDYNSSNKRSRVKKFLSSEKKILIGPSILEGLDLKDDLARFQILFKVPYPSLQDPLVKAKLAESQEWYDWKTSISIIQGLNRGIRKKTGDWAISYVIDSCFIDLVKKKMFDVTFMKRLKIYEYSNEDLGIEEVYTF